ncbi:GTP pyrophosphokinase family protein [Paenibacillus timonensis]|jgi:putative GTP pyrophosphokinase|uniref:GTP pyrophosphokinase family protein n=1 Tax=Paenibacillus timonensis TaxID=225915 RepID=A0ABW3SAD5_9BACL|nr:GTP pyrophosphokinase family protein [Paenibacillus timonensis]MCH1639838.1 GTP pyrophosphokinase family protein [Paenibacillus timonensis]
MIDNSYINPLEQMKALQKKLTRFIMMYKFALHEVETKIEILQEEFQLLHEYNPIEHTKSRIKSPESIMKKLYRKGGATSIEEIKRNIRDIAGIRITCSFISDIYRISEMLRAQKDLNILSVKDYIKHPKPNGYKSLHMLVEVPVFMSDGEELVCVEIQIRTIAMDFWASLEHKIFYKYNESVPDRLLEDLKNAADTAYELDLKMEQLQQEMEEIKHAHQAEASGEFQLLIDNQKISIPQNLLKLLSGGE